MRYNTGNPVGPDGSSDPRDLYDNAGIIDLLLTGPLGEQLNRLGVPLKSWLGIMQQVTDYLIAQGYESVYLIYGAGVVVQRQTQLVERSGELYRVMNAADIPLTLTGNWATDAPKLQAVGDAALRQALAAIGGAAMVNTSTGESVETRLANADTKIADLLARPDTSTYARKNGLLLSNAYYKLKSNQAVKIVCQGDSITAGQDTNSPDKIPDDNGNWTTMAAVQYPPAMQNILRIFTGVNHIATKRGYSGDTAKSSFNRWTVNPESDVVHLMLGINDSLGANGATYAEYIDYMERIIRRHIDWGCGVVLHTVTPQYFDSGSPLAPVFSQALRTIADCYGCPVFESDTFCQYAIYASVYSDPTHFNAHGYNKYGNAVGAFIMAGGWVQKPKMVKGEIHLQTGRGSEGIGFISRGANLAQSTGSYLTNRATGQMTTVGDRISYTFFMDTEFMDVMGVGDFTDLSVALSFTIGPQYVGDTRAAGSVNGVTVESLRNRNIRETTLFTVGAGRTRHPGNITMLGTLVGRGWKTISVAVGTAITGSRFFGGLILKERSLEQVGRPDAGTSAVGTLSPASMDTFVYQHPYPVGAASSVTPPAAVALPAIMYLPCPRGLLPYQSAPTNFYDHIPAELTITSPAGWIKVLLRRTASGNALTISKIAGDAAGDAFLPTSAQFVYREFDDATAEPTGAFTSGIGVGSQNQYLQLAFGTTTANHYQLTIHCPHKSGTYGLF